MIDLAKAGLPEAIEVDGSLYPVRTSFKYWLRFVELIADRNARPHDFDFMYATDLKPESRFLGLAMLMRFCSPPHELPRTEKGSEQVLDYTVDADYIYAAFFERYGIDLVDSDMHWYKFQSLLRGLHDTKLNEIVSYRLYDGAEGHNDAYSRRMEQLRRAWELPQQGDDNDEDLKQFEARLKGEQYGRRDKN